MEDNKPKITFFMPVTNRDAVIADYAIRSYRRVKDIPFRLRVYSNWLSPALKRRHFPRWKSFPFVDLLENEWQREDGRPRGKEFRGSHFKAGYVWDQELTKINTPYHATVDADFEILDGGFIRAMLERLNSDPELIAMSTEYGPRNERWYNSYTGNYIQLNERWHTWFCMYKRAALACPVSREPVVEHLPDSLISQNVWDDCAYFQKTLKEEGYKLAALDNSFRRCFIHYGAFAHNRHITPMNVGTYRQLKILQKAGLFGVKTRFLKEGARFLDQALFGHFDRSRRVGDGSGDGLGESDPASPMRND